ncbi:MAG: metal ABC transporter permease [Anaerolineae bacterium]|nr:metal ABC transporter permease [Anaerolineae bacterium]
MLDILSYTFMQRALVASTLIGIVTAVVGVYVVLRGMAFMGAGIAHASFGGVALGFLLGWSLIATAAIFSLLGALGIGLVSRRSEIREDTAIGIFFTSSMAFGVLLVGLLRGFNVDLFGFLFGSVLAVTRQDLILSGILGVLVLVTVGFLYKELMFISFDPEMAQVVGVPAVPLYYLLLGLIAVTIVISIRVVGVILVEALIVTPAAAAYQLTNDFRRMMAIAIAVGVVSGITGLFLSYWFNVASGATIVLTATFLFGLAALFSPRRRAGSIQPTNGSGEVPACPSR